ncbi:uncharacterized protein LOC106641023 isoform X2 [Copidosoma floridanum]|uniref:uncharacterized protein LOC106641023 isoform X2 n=1 Tax=Copidosoma floridanum TaxID=29053 RepID=UPI000C6FB6C6|nr:uncharacterized protein LOC106641023 isoform X2 [Copidosoma floridanum]
MKTQRAVSFDESSMESGLATTPPHQQDEHQRQCDSGLGSQECTSCRDVTREPQQQEVTSLEEARKVIAALRARQRAQAHQMLAWRRTLKLQEELVSRLTREKAEQLRSLSSQLLLFESRLCRKQKEIEACLGQREAIIMRQQRAIKQLQQRLRNTGESTPGSPSMGGRTPGAPDTRAASTPLAGDSPPCDALDSLGDSDSAVVLDFLDDPSPPRFRSNLTDVTVIRSVSDAVEPANKYCAASRRCNGFLRRPEVLETVYSVEEDADGDRPEPTDAEADNDPRQQPDHRDTPSSSGKPRLRDLYGSFERLQAQQSQGAASADKPAASPAPVQRTRDESSQQAQVTYNRVMSNHRSVTKPKDVKYKRINKAKSKSLEELRGRLRNWVEKGNKIAISLDQSYA